MSEVATYLELRRRVELEALAGEATFTPLRAPAPVTLARRAELEARASAARARLEASAPIPVGDADTAPLTRADIRPGMRRLADGQWYYSSRWL